MPDIVVTVPRNRWNEWIAEGDRSDDACGKQGAGIADRPATFNSHVHGRIGAFNEQGYGKRLGNRIQEGRNRVRRVEMGRSRGPLVGSQDIEDENRQERR